MQDRYAADIGDFVKLGLLRAVCHDAGGSLRLGVCWYLVPDEDHNTDGRHVDYLTAGHRHASSLRSCDEQLYDRLRLVLHSGSRSVESLEAAGVLPPGTVTYRRPIHRAMTATERESWHEGSLRALAGADLVFLDPDNGIEADRPGIRPSFKRAAIREVADYTSRNQSVIVYHHADRSRGGVTAQLARRLGELAEGTGSVPIGAVIARRASVRFFLALPADRHRERIESAVEGFARRWFPHVELWRWPC